MKTIPVNLTLIEDHKGEAIGYEISSPLESAPEYHSIENEVLERVRDMYFWKSVKYDGRTSFPGTDQTNKLKFTLRITPIMDDED